MATSIIAAVMDRVDGLPEGLFPGSVRPAVYLDMAPLTDGTGAQVHPPYLILTDHGTETVYDFERNVFETTELTLTAYADSLADADATCEALKYGPGDIDGAEGLDHCTLALAAAVGARESHSVIRTGERAFLAPGLGRTGQRTHARELRYKITLRRTVGGHQ